MQHLGTFLNLELKWQLQKDQKGSAISTRESLSCLLINASGMWTPVPIALGWSCQLIWGKSLQGLWDSNIPCSFVMSFATQDSIVSAGKRSRTDAKQKKQPRKKCWRAREQKSKITQQYERGNKKHMKMKSTSMYVNICHLQQYDLQNKGDGFPAA